MGNFVPTVPRNPHLPYTRINNAGTNAYRYGPLAESEDEELAQIVSTNVLGVMLCCKEVRQGGRVQSLYGRSAYTCRDVPHVGVVLGCKEVRTGRMMHAATAC